MVKLNFTKKQLSQAGIVLVIIFLLAGYYSKNDLWLKVSIILLFTDLIAPVLFYPFALVWYNFGEIMGLFVSKIVLGLIFFLILTPVGLLRKLMKKDSLLLNDFKKDKHSVLKIRNYTYAGKDLIKPY